MDKKIVPRFGFSIHTDGKLVMDSTDVYTRYKNSILKPGDRGYITINKEYRRRTSGQPDELGNQNGYYWAVIIPIIQEYSPDLTPHQIHEMLKEKFLAKEKIKAWGEEIEILGSTSDKKTWEFNDYLEKIKVFFSQWGLIFPEPNTFDIHN